ncbi:hypothetical protein, partial [Escherichia coli]|uniref:hypothetical protein n=1 Tax=Escherichia coli TaxID=562 RepID=UPI0019D615EF
IAQQGEHKADEQSQKFSAHLRAHFQESDKCRQPHEICPLLSTKGLSPKQKSTAFSILKKYN